MSGINRNLSPILHVPFTYHPDALGGTEIYVQSLAQEQLQMGLPNLVAAPGIDNRRGIYNGIECRRFAVSPAIKDLKSLYGQGDDTAAMNFKNILDDVRPSLVHFHAFTSAVSIQLARYAKLHGLPVVFTYHTPTISCMRGTLLCYGRDVCDGALRVPRCAACTLQGKGAGEFLSRILSWMPPSFGESLERIGCTGKVWTALRMTELAKLRFAVIREWLSVADRVVVLCKWTWDLLLRLGIKEEKLFLCRHGLPRQEHASGDVPSRQRSGPLRIAFLGRLDPTKGADLLVDAMRGLQEFDIELSIFGISQNDGGKYSTELKKNIEFDRRIRLRAPVPSNEVTALLKGFDVLAVPSKWMETGPLVVLEAFAAGIPVIGSNLGGITEWVEHEVNGLLVEPSVGAWRHMLEQLTHRKKRGAIVAGPISIQRTMKAVAMEMADLYESLFRASIND